MTNIESLRDCASLDGERLQALWDEIDRLSRPAHEREPPHCSTCACGAHEPTENAVMRVLAEWDAEPDNGSLVDLGLRILEARRKARGAENRGEVPERKRASQRVPVSPGTDEG